VYKIDLHIGAINQFLHEPTKRAVLAGENAKVQCSGEKKSLQQDRENFSENWSLRKFGVLPS
jgi:hypothetical protein